MADLTVVVPTYNGARFLAATLTSLQRQRGIAIEVVVVDDGSTDDSVVVASSHSVGARVVKQPNAGVAVARNRGLAEASGAWVAFLDQDDLWHPDRAAILLDLADRAGSVAAATTEQSFALESDRTALVARGDGRDRWPASWIADGAEIEVLLAGDVGGSGAIEQLTVERLMMAPATVTTALVYERITALSAGGCAPFVPAVDDHVLNVNIARLAGPIPRIDRPGLFYRVHPRSTTTTTPLAAPYLTTLLALRHGGTLPRQPVQSPYVDHLLSQLHECPLSTLEQAALLVLSTRAEGRARKLAGWAKRRSRTTLLRGRT